MLGIREELQEGEVDWPDMDIHCVLMAGAIVLITVLTAVAHAI